MMPVLPLIFLNSLGFAGNYSAHIACYESVAPYQRGMERDVTSNSEMIIIQRGIVTESIDDIPEPKPGFYVYTKDGIFDVVPPSEKLHGAFKLTLPGREKPYWISHDKYPVRRLRFSNQPLEGAEELIVRDAKETTAVRGALLDHIRAAVIRMASLRYVRKNKTLKKRADALLPCYNLEHSIREAAIEAHGDINHAQGRITQIPFKILEDFMDESGTAAR